jgi:methyl-accepting chemotaxis protein
MTEDVRGSGAGMREGTEQIDASIRKISDIVEENSEGIGQMADGVGDISGSMARLAELSDRNSANMRTLDLEMSKFKTD